MLCMTLSSVLILTIDHDGITKSVLLAVYNTVKCSDTVGHDSITKTVCVCARMCTHTHDCAGA